MIFGSTKKEAAGKAGTNGPAPPRAATKAVKRRPRQARQLRLAQSFSQVVAVLMRDPNFRNLKIADLEWLILPPLMAGQFRLAHATSQPKAAKAEAGKTTQGTTQGGISIPVAVALWARVSPEIDKALTENLDKQARLRPNQWASGNNLWLMADRKSVV